MLFNSYLFIFLFLPLTLSGFYLLRQKGPAQAAQAYLVMASMFFYGWWNPAYLLLITSSIGVNFLLGQHLAKNRNSTILCLGIIFNLGLIGYYKYSHFFVENINALCQTNYVLDTILLPLGISFFTFQQIAYLVDSYRGDITEQNLLHYTLFVTFFPQLIAGPIVKHQDVIHQYSHLGKDKSTSRNLVVGSTLFFIGLFKKVLLADSVSLYATPIFNAAEKGLPLTIFEAWTGALAYTFQLYYDFSGYSDMALGLGCMFGITLPVNFFSPYKATSIIEFWKRWHITLSSFLMNYLYFPLGGNRKGHTRKYFNLGITMLLAGLWHGAGWTFVLWGGLHGIFLMLNHLWRYLHPARGNAPSPQFRNISAQFLTFSCVTVAWVLFRAESLNGAEHIISAMAGLNGISLPGALKETAIASLLPGVDFHGMFHHGILANPLLGLGWVASLWALSWLTPNSMEWLRKESPALQLEAFSIPRKIPTWRPSPVCLATMIFLAVTSLMFIQKDSEFLYFQF